MIYVVVFDCGMAYEHSVKLYKVDIIFFFLFLGCVTVQKTFINFKQKYVFLARQ